MSHRICLCPKSIAWIRKHLTKSARRTFTKMISRGSIKRVAGASMRRMTTSRRRRRSFSRKQLAAQRLFARRAKAGTLRRHRRK